MDRINGLQAWRWLFILEGLPSCLCAILAFFIFPDYPETAKWLSSGQRAVLIQRLNGVASQGHARISWAETKATLLDWRLYLHYLVFVAISPAFSSISLFVPTIVTGLGYEGLQAQLFTVPPYAITFVVTILVAWQSEKHEMRSWGALCSMLAAGIAFILLGMTSSLRPAPRSYLMRVQVHCLRTPSTSSTDCSVSRFLLRSPVYHLF